MFDKTKIAGRNAVAGLLKMDKMQLIYWILKARERDDFLLQGNVNFVPEDILDDAESLRDMTEESKVDIDSAYHNFQRFCDGHWWICSKCGIFSSKEETKRTLPHASNCDGLCDYKVTACDFFEEHV